MLQLKKLTFSAPIDSTDGNAAGKDIIKDLDLDVEAGKLIVITGPNGGGKSTLAKLIAGIYETTSGQILFNGEDITALDVTERAKKGVSFAFQRPVCFKGFTVGDMRSNFLSSLLTHGILSYPHRGSTGFHFYNDRGPLFG